MDLGKLFTHLNGAYNELKSTIEPRFSCVVCLAAKFKMVYGLCQHKICVSCAYKVDGNLKPAFRRCPTCQVENVFPLTQPNIPEDNITAQKLCGVRVCEYKGCNQEFWEWEQDEHKALCSYRISTPQPIISQYKDQYSPVTPKSRHRRNHSPKSHSQPMRTRSRQNSDVYSSSKQTKFCNPVRRYHLRHRDNREQA